MPSSRTNVASSKATQIKPYLIFLVVSADIFQCVLVLDIEKCQKENKHFCQIKKLKKMAIEEVDAAVSKKIAILEERKSRCELFQMIQQKSQDDDILAPEMYIISISESSADHESDITEDLDYLETPSSKMKKN